LAPARIVEKAARAASETGGAHARPAPLQFGQRRFAGRADVRKNRDNSLQLRRESTNRP
jgi:hypothetical protein